MILTKNKDISHFPQKTEVSFEDEFLEAARFSVWMDMDQPVTKDQSDMAGVKDEDDSHALIAEGVRAVLRAIAAWPVNENEDPFDGTLDSIRPPWEEDAELRKFLEMDSEPETPDEVETKQIEESLSQSLQESKTETETLPEPPSNLTRSASCDELRDAKQLVDKLQEILDDPFESKERKLSQGQKLVRSLSDLLLVSAEDESGEALKTPTIENQRSKSFTGLKKSYAIPKAVNTSVPMKVPNMKLHNTEFEGKLKIKKSDHEMRRGPLKAIPLEKLRNIKKTPDRDGTISKPNANSTPISASAIMQNTRRSPTLNRKFHSDGPVVLRSIKLSPSKQPQKKKEGPTKLIAPKRAGSLGKMSVNK